VFFFFPQKYFWIYYFSVQSFFELILYE